MLALCQFNIGQIRYPLTDKRMKGFVENVDRVNRLADESPGFIWRLQDSSGHAMNMRVYDDPTILPNLTMWFDLRCLKDFLNLTIHKKFFDNRRKWFLPLEAPNIMWWGDDDNKPTLLEGVKRRDYYLNNGETEHAWTFGSV